ncbi:MAG: XRE family transcriptional regulator [Alphaproteobacteria bacterium]|nr:MAG: XRE family transcriptional regulator [Alphaproteobacteria bacterium]
MELQALQALLGTNVRLARRAVGLTQEDLADLIGVAQDYVSKLESGQKNPELATLHRLSTALKVKPHELILPHDP